MLFSNALMVTADEPLKGSVMENGEYKNDQSDIFTGSVETLNRKEIINMTVSQILDSSISIEGDEFLLKLQMMYIATRG